MPLKPGDVLADKYNIEAEVGRGAYGRVFRARDTLLDRVVALKALVRGEDDLGSTAFVDYVRRFKREAKVQARFNHPHIVHVYELLEPRAHDSDEYYLVMEYVDGGSLKTLLEQRGPLSIEDALRLMRELLSALAVVHADPRDIVHRDLKPSNLLLTRGGQLKLTDFGLAQLGDESGRSGAGQPHPGTALYMSPEQETTNAYLYPASDIFSAGCVLFEMLTAQNYKQALRRKKTLRDLRPDTPEWVAEVLAQMLTKDPEMRPDGEAVLEMLKAGEKQKVEERRKTEDERRRQDEQREAEELVTKEKRKAEEREADRKRKEAEELARRVEAQRVAPPIQYPQSKVEILSLASDVAIELVRVPAGEFVMGSDNAQDQQAYDIELPQQKLFLPKYMMGKTPVTIAQFTAFVRASGYACDKNALRDIRQFSAHPVNYVSWKDAVAFCQWASQVTGQQVRLPSEALWEKAARGTEGQLWPWGNEPPTEKHCNFNNNVKDTTPMGQYSPQGDSPYGCVDMAGNVWEWTSSLNKGYPYNASDGREDSGGEIWRVSRGGSFHNLGRDVRCAFRNWDRPNYRYDKYGFRVCVLQSP